MPNGYKVIAPKEARNVYTIVRAGEIVTVTIPFTASAAVKSAPPLILFELKILPKRSILNEILKRWVVGITEEGWMTADSFYGSRTFLFNG